mmetsp:Transcript_23021/g.29475  ORF Transcript_23021/g.29475 Transcript_23021/m.29475 type:complete len:111 (-) Transcript_23021:194-526(-)
MIQNFYIYATLYFLLSYMFTRAMAQRPNLELRPFSLCAFGMKSEVLSAIGCSARFSQNCLYATWMTSNVWSRIINRITNKDPSRVGVIVSAQLAHRVGFRLFFFLRAYAR